MAAKGITKSIEPNIADLANGWLKAYHLDYKLEQESLNTEIDTALYDYFSKNGGVGGNRPDAKLLLQDKNLSYYPILMEYKGYKDKLVKLDSNGQVLVVRCFSYKVRAYEEDLQTKSKAEIYHKCWNTTRGIV